MIAKTEEKRNFTKLILNKIKIITTIHNSYIVLFIIIFGTLSFPIAGVFQGIHKRISRPCNVLTIIVGLSFLHPFCMFPYNCKFH